MAGVDPKIGLYAYVVIAFVIAFTGGRPAMISAATASTAVLMVGPVRDHGVQYLLAATILIGVFRILAGIFKFSRLMRFVSQSALTGLRTDPWPSSAVMLATADPAKGVPVGVLLSGVFFAKVSRLGRITFGLSTKQRMREPVEQIVIDVPATHFRGTSAVFASDRLVMKARRQHRIVEAIGLNAAGNTMVERLASYNKPETLFRIAKQQSYAV